jgi:hypothetical protein
MAEQVGALGAEAILILCTNLGGAPLVQRIECKLQLPVLDSDVFGLADCDRYPSTFRILALPDEFVGGSGGDRCYVGEFI